MQYYLYAFGSNGASQLGLGKPSDTAFTPKLVPGFASDEPIRSVAGGGNHTLILGESGSVYMAGANDDGQLDHHRLLKYGPDQTKRPKFCKRFSNISFCAATEAASAYIINPHTEYNSTKTAQVFTEGRNIHGELGRKDDAKPIEQDLVLDRTIDQFSPLYIPPIALPGKVVGFAAGLAHFVAVLENGEVWGWGLNQHCQLGTGLEATVTQPARLDIGEFKAVRAVCGKYFTYIVGEPATGEHLLLGLDRSANRILKEMPDTNSGWKSIGATWKSIITLSDSGQLTIWGADHRWTVGPTATPIDQIAVGSDHVIALTETGKLLSWGWGYHGNCGDLSNYSHRNSQDLVSDVPNEITGIPGEIRLIGAGYCTSFVLVVDNRLG